MTTRLAVLAAVALAAAGCLVETREVRDPGPAFDAARGTAARLQGRPGPARRLNILAYDARDHELTRVRLPLWLAKKTLREGDLGAGGEAGERAVARLRQRDLGRVPLGTLVEADEDGERVLIWLD